MGRLLVALLLAGSIAAPPSGSPAPSDGSPAPAPGSPGPNDGVGPEIAVQWRLDGSASEPPRAGERLALREAIAARDGRPLALILDDAHAEARRVVAHELPRTVRTRALELRAGLDRADAAYRGGDFGLARAEAGAVLDQLHAQPEQPGAVASAREAHLLLAKVAWAAGEAERAEDELSEALTIDPTATLSTRAAAPALVERYEAVQAELLASRPSWRAPTLDLGEGPGPGAIEIELDGLPGPRPLPPGSHFMVVRRPGHAPAAAWHERDATWVVPATPERVVDELQAAIPAICEALALDALVLAERRGERVGIEVHGCARGSEGLWVGARDELDGGVARAFEAEAASSPNQALRLFGAWPERMRVDLGLIEAPPPPARPWYRKGWIWGTSVGAAVVVGGAIAAGVLLGGARSPRIEVDATPFIGP